MYHVYYRTNPGRVAAGRYLGIKDSYDADEARDIIRRLIGMGYWAYAVPA